MLLDIFRVVGGIFLGVVVACVLVLLALSIVLREVSKVESDYDQ